MPQAPSSTSGLRQSGGRCCRAFWRSQLAQVLSSRNWFPRAATRQLRCGGGFIYSTAPRHECRKKHPDVKKNTSGDARGVNFDTGGVFFDIGLIFCGIRSPERWVRGLS